MDFRQFRYFVTTADELHFARAAERLGIAQPALSQQIKVLETQLGVRLFQRAKRRVELTEAGTAFLQEARTTLELAEKAVRVAQDTARGEAGRIDIGIVGSVMFEPRFPHLLKAYRKVHRGVQLSLHEMPILAQIDAVRKRHLDIAIIRDPIPPNMPEDLDYFVLSGQHVVAVLPEDHPLAGADSVHLPALAEDDFLAFQDPEGLGMAQVLLNLCRSAGFEPKITQRVSEIATLISLVAAGFGVSMVVEIISHLQLPGVRYLPLAGMDARSELIVVHRRFERSAAVCTLLENIREASRAADHGRRVESRRV
jgi:DNA-binding transcriptional LysR family regulator